MATKYSNILYTTVLVALLFVPFIIRFIAPVLEAYPAVLLPTGGGWITVADQMDFDRRAVYGRVAGRADWIRLSPLKFLDPIPLQYFPLLTNQYFGLVAVGPIANKTKIGMTIITEPRKVTSAEVQNAKSWIRSRLEKTGYDDGALRITREIVTTRRSDGAEIGLRYEDDKVFDLH